MEVIIYENINFVWSAVLDEQQKVVSYVGSWFGPTGQRMTVLCHPDKLPIEERVRLNNKIKEL